MRWVAFGSVASLHDGRLAYGFTDSSRTTAPFLYATLIATPGAAAGQPVCQGLSDLVDAVDGVDFGQFLVCAAGTKVSKDDARWMIQGFADALPMPGAEPTGAFIWAANAAEVLLDLDRGLLVTKAASGWALLAQSPNIILPANAATAFLLNAEQPGDGDLQVTLDTVQIGAARPISLSVGTGSPISYSVRLIADFGTTDACGGCVLTAVLGDVGRQLRIGFAFLLEASPSVTSPSANAPVTQFYPLFDKPGTDALTGVEATISAPFSGTATLSLPADQGPLSSGYRTSLGDTVQLQPGKNARMEATLAGDGSLSFAPYGTWTATIARSGVKTFELICGLSGLETIQMSAGDSFNFFTEKPALVYATEQRQAGGTPAPPHLRWAPDGSGATTAYVAPQAQNGSLVYAKHSQLLPLFAVTANSSGLLLAIDPGEWTLASPASSACAFPMAPYGGLSPFRSPADVSTLQALEGGLFAPLRESIITTAGSAGAADPKLTAVTPQGFVLTFGASGLSELQFAASPTTGDAIGVQLTPAAAAATAAGGGWQGAFERALADAKPFIVISTNPEGSGGLLTPSLAMDGWQFDLTLAEPTDAATGHYKAILIVKACAGSLSSYIGNPKTWSERAAFNDDTVDQDGEILAGYLQDYIAQTRLAYAGGAGCRDFADFLELIDNPSWTGAIILNAPIDLTNCPPDIQAMLIGTDLGGGPLCAHHIVASPGRLKVDNGLAIAASSFDAVVTYLRPGVSLGAIAHNQLGLLPSTSGDQFLLLHLRAVFKNAVLKHFQSAAALVVSALFGEQVTTGSLDGLPTAGTNAMVVNGVMHIGADGNPTYAFVSPSGSPGVFYLNSTAIDHVLVNKITTDLQLGGPNADTVVTFHLGGWMRMRQSVDFDLLSYDALALDGLKVTMSYRVGSGAPPPRFALDTADITITPSVEMLVTTEPDPFAALPTGHLFRSGSLVSQWPLRLSSLEIPLPSQTPEGMGFQPVTLPTVTNAAAPLGDDWFGLRFSLPLGSRGMAGTSQLLSAELLLAWTVVPADRTTAPTGGAVVPYFRILGPDGAPLHIDIEGVITVGIDAVHLRTTNPGTTDVPEFALVLQGIGLTVLSKTFPMNGGATVYLGGTGGTGPQRGLGWFGGLASGQTSAPEHPGCP